MALNRLKPLQDVYGKVKSAISSVLPQRTISPIPQYNTEPTYNRTLNQARIAFMKPLAQAQNFINSNKSFQPIPTFTAPQTQYRGLNALGQAGAFVGNIGGGFVNSIVGKGIVDPALDIGRMAGNTLTGRANPSYNSLKSPQARLAYNVMGYNRTPQQIVGNVAGTAMPIFDAYGGGKVFGIGKEAAKQVGKQGFKQLLKQGVKEGAVYGGAGGALQGLDQARNAETLFKQLQEGLKQGAIGTAVGGALGGALSSGGYAVGRTLQTLAGTYKRFKPQATTQETEQVVKSFIRDELGRFAKSGSTKKKSEPVFYSDFRESLGLPRTGDYNAGFIKPDELVGGSKPQQINTGAYTPIKEVDGKVQIEQPKETIKRLVTAGSNAGESAAQQRARTSHIPEMEPLPWEKDGYKDTGIAANPKQKNKTGPVPTDTTPQYKQFLQNWRNKVLVGKQQADQVTTKFTGIPDSEGLKIIKFLENPSKQKAKELNLDVKAYAPQMRQLRTYYDSIRQEAVKRGLDVGYLDNYVNHVWKETPKEIFDLVEKNAKGIGKIPSFVKERRIPTYEEGLKAGLTPRFTHPAQLAAHYRLQLERATAAQELVKGLQKSGVIQDVDNAPIGWKVIDAPLVPDLNGKFAPQKIAEELSNIFGQQPENMWTKAVDLGAKVSRAMQEVTLSGGFRTLNAFSLGNMIKEFTAGRFKSPIQAFVRSFADQPTKAYFQENSKVLKELAQQGVPLRTNLDYRSAYKNMAESDSMTKAFGRFWDNNINAPTFSRFLPMLQVEFYKDARKSGMSTKEAAKALKNFYGVVDNFSRPKWAEDTLSTIFFAPRFRESMLNFWVNNAKSLKNITSREYRANQAFIAGTLATYVLMSALNKQLTGRYMHENKEGKEFAVEIPRGNGRSWFIPMLPSIGTLPRRGLEMGSALLHGDLAGVGQKAGSFASQLFSLASQLVTNRTFYGGPIYNQDDSTLGKYGKLAGYGLSQSMHPFLGEPIEVMQGRKTPGEALLGMAEMPVYPSRSTEAADLVGTQFKKYQDLLKQDPNLAKTFLSDAERTRELNKQKKEAEKELNTNNSNVVIKNDMVYIKTTKGDIKAIDVKEQITAPQFTGNPTLDKELLSDYKSAINSKKNDIVDLFNAGILTKDQAETALLNLEGLKSQYGGGSAKKLKLPSIPKAKIKTPKKISLRKLRLAQIKPIKAGQFKLGSKRTLTSMV